MAVYTRVSAEVLADFLTEFDVGAPLSFKGIAEGVENSNYLLETTTGRYILTLYEKRVNPDDLPYFLALMDHVAAEGVRAARPIKSHSGDILHSLAGRPAALIEFLPGLSVEHPTPRHGAAAGETLATFHRATDSFSMRRANDLGLPGWQKLAEVCAASADTVQAGLGKVIADELAFQTTLDVSTLPFGTCHLDLFPDNVLFARGESPGVIDFYFAADDAYAYDLGVMVGSWSFASGTFQPDIAAAVIAGYERMRRLSDAEKAAFPALCRGSALRFLLTRLYDWLNPVEGAVVTPKDPLAYLRILDDFRARNHFEDYAGGA